MISLGRRPAKSSSSIISVATVWLHHCLKGLVNYEQAHDQRYAASTASAAKDYQPTGSKERRGVMKGIAIVSLGFILCLGLAGVTLSADAPERSVTGTLIDTYCNTVVGAHGASHGRKVRDRLRQERHPGRSRRKSGTGKVFMLLPNKNRAAASQRRDRCARWKTK